MANCSLKALLSAGGLYSTLSLMVFSLLIFVLQFSASTASITCSTSSSSERCCLAMTSLPLLKEYTPAIRMTILPHCDDVSIPVEPGRLSRVLTVYGRGVLEAAFSAFHYRTGKFSLY